MNHIQMQLKWPAKYHMALFYVKIESNQKAFETIATFNVTFQRI
jgi:hypothetical protein